MKRTASLISLGLMVFVLMTTASLCQGAGPVPVSYTHLISPNNTFPDDGNVEMTDGIYDATGYYADPAWTSWMTVDAGGAGLPLIVFDFGSSKSFSGISITELNAPVYSIMPIGTFSLSFSDDNSNWSDPVSFTTTSAEQAGDQVPSTIARDVAGNCRYVKLSVDSQATAGTWVFIDEVTFMNAAATPTFSPVAGNYDSPQSVTISSTGGDIWYTTDGTDPTQGSGTSIHYTGAIPVDQTTTLKAKAWKSGLDPSIIASATYRILAPVSYTHLNSPYNFDDGGNVEMTDGIYGTTNYADAAWTGWHQDFGLPLIDFDFGVSKTFTSISIYGLNYPGIGVGPIGSFSVSFSDDDSTWSDPVSFTTTSGEQAGDPGLTTITRNLSGSGRYLKLSVNSIVGYPSTPYVFIGEVTFVPTVAIPTFTPYSGNLLGAQTVTISSATTDADVWYTTDGSEPTQGGGTSIHYTGPITVDHTMPFPFKAKAWKTDYIPSSVAVSGPYVFPRPQNIPFGAATIDGDLSDWAGATWAPLDQIYPLYWYIPGDISEAYYTARWTAKKVYVAVKVRDTAHVFSNGYNYAHCDNVEIYIHTTGTGPVESNLTTQADAQQYEVGITSDNSSAVWNTITGLTIPAWAGITVAGSVGAGDNGSWIYYEAALTPFEHFDMNDPNQAIVSTLSPGQAIGVDVVAATVTASDATGLGMKSENLLSPKTADYTKIGVHKLAGYAAIDLAAMLAAMDSTSTGGGNWNSLMDLDRDGAITSTDLSILLANME